MLPRNIYQGNGCGDSKSLSNDKKKQVWDDSFKFLQIHIKFSLLWLHFPWEQLLMHWLRFGKTMWLGIPFFCCTHDSINLLLSASECNPFPPLLSGIRIVSPGSSKTFRTKIIVNSFLTGLSFQTSMILCHLLEWIIWNWGSSRKFICKSFSLKQYLIWINVLAILSWYKHKLENYCVFYYRSCSGGNLYCFLGLSSVIYFTWGMLIPIA